MAYFADLLGPALYDCFYDYGRHGAQLLVEAVRDALASATTVLDVGTGTGFVALAAAAVASRGHVTGIDLDEDALIVARYKAQQQGIANVTFAQGDALQLDFAAGSFDVVLGSQVFGGAETQAQFIQEMCRVLRPGGMIGLVRPHPPGNRFFLWVEAVLQEVARRQGQAAPAAFDLSRSDPKILRSLLERAGLAVVQLERLPAGTASFPAMILDQIAQKQVLFAVSYALQDKAEDRDAMVRGCLDYLQVGQQMLDRQEGGRMAWECLVLVGRKPD